MSQVPRYALRCSDVHSRGCRQIVRGDDVSSAIASMQEHGEAEHGYPPAFYEKATISMYAKLTNAD